MRQVQEVSCGALSYGWAKSCTFALLIPTSRHLQDELSKEQLRNSQMVVLHMFTALLWGGTGNAQRNWHTTGAGNATSQKLLEVPNPKPGPADLSQKLSAAAPVSKSEQGHTHSGKKHLPLLLWARNT